MPAAPRLELPVSGGHEYWPLLPEDGQRSVRATAAQLRDFGKSWWGLTTSASYLTCVVSRRGLRRFFLPAFAVLNVLGDVALQAPALWAAPAAAVFLGPLAVLPSRQLAWDALAVCAALTHSAAWLLGGDLAEGHAARAFAALAAYWALSLSLLAGVHAVFLVAYVCLLASCLAFALGAGGCLTGLALGTAVVGLLAVMDGKVGAAWEELQRRETCTKQLLDGLSDGFCTLEPGSSVIRTASPKLDEIFEATGLEGRDVLDLVRFPSDRAQLEKALAEAHDNAAPATSRPLSCQSVSGAAAFDAMIVPFAISRDELNVGIRIVGEKHSAVCKGPDHRPMSAHTSTAVPTAAAPPPAWDAQQLCGHGGGGGNGGAAPGEAGAGPDVSFALSWADDAVQAALLAPRPPGGGGGGGGSPLGRTQPVVKVVSTQTDAEPPPPPPPPPPPAAGHTAPAPAEPAPAQAPAAAAPEVIQFPPSLFEQQRRPRSSGSRRSRSRGQSSEGGQSSAASTVSASSETSIGMSASAMARPNIAAFFTTTALLMRRKSIIIAMHHWCLPRNPDACCPWHTAVCAVDEVVRLEASTPCKPFWSPFLGWQCANCSCVNHPTVAPCNVCGADRVGPGAAMGE